MNIYKKLQTIYNIIPSKHQGKSFKFIFFSIINVFLDLVSIAYLIPIFVLIFDKNAIPVFLQEFINSNQLYSIYFLVIFVLSFIVKSLIQIKITNFQSDLIFDIATDISSKLTKTFLQGNYKDFQEIDTGKKIQNISIVGVDFSNHILLSINTFFTEFSLIAIIVIISLYVFFKTTLLIIAVIALFFIFFMRYRKKRMQLVNDTMKETYASATSTILNIIQGVLEIKSLRKERFFLNKFHTSIEKFNSNFSTITKLKSIHSRYLEVFMILGLISFFLILQHGNLIMPKDKLFLISFAAGTSIKLLPSLSKIMIAYGNYTSFNYTINILENINESDFNTKEVLFRNSLKLEKLSFSYENNVVIFDQINLEIKKGDFVGILGNSGIGKTTLLNLIMNNLQASSGALLLDNTPISSKENLFSFINYVPQDPFLFNGTVLENIVIDKSDSIDFKRIARIAEVLNLDSFFERLPQKLYTKIDHNSLKISGGQKQRIALLRALYTKPDFLILDEATNQLDTILERKVFDYLIQLNKYDKLTILMVSHNHHIKHICNHCFYIQDKKIISASQVPGS